MQQIKSFKIGEDETINEFLKKHPPIESGSLLIRNEHVVIIYEDETGYTTAMRHNKLRIKLTVLLEQEIDLEISERAFKAALLFKSGDAEFQKQEAIARQSREAIHIQIRVLKNMLEEPEKQDDEVASFLGKKDYSRTKKGKLRIE